MITNVVVPYLQYSSETNSALQSLSLVETSQSLELCKKLEQNERSWCGKHRCADPGILGLHPHLQCSVRVHIHKTMTSGVRTVSNSDVMTVRIKDRWGPAITNVACASASFKLVVSGSICVCIDSRNCIHVHVLIRVRRIQHSFAASSSRSLICSTLCLYIYLYLIQTTNDPLEFLQRSWQPERSLIGTQAAVNSFIQVSFDSVQQVTSLRDKNTWCEFIFHQEEGLTLYLILSPRINTKKIANMNWALTLVLSLVYGHIPLLYPAWSQVGNPGVRPALSALQGG